jgi:hypothetical protein
LKPTVAAFLNNGCNFNEVPIPLKKPLKLCISEYIPYVFLSDGYHYIEGHFTKEAINEFRKNFSTMKFSNMSEKVLIISRWRLVMKSEDSRTSYTSYQNLSVQLVVESFRPLVYEKPALR